MDISKAVGISLHISTLKIILPVGISFYTFQALSYSIDVYRQKLSPAKNIIDFFAFISFFPQLVAGPIERATNLLTQIQKKRNFNYQQAIDGCRQMLWGFVKKICVADCCAVYADHVFDNWQNLSGGTLLFGAIFFAFQIYGDFSGYSDIAVGCSKLFGINLMRNFNVPYFSRDIAEFWRRWHISLTTWFRDYVYIPLGGSKTTKAKIIRNTFIIFLVSGLWHGANWTYLVWGCYHAVLFMPLIISGKNRKYTDIAASKRQNDGSLKLYWFPSLKEFFQMGITFGLAVAGWIIFRAESIRDVFGYMKIMADDAVHCRFSVSGGPTVSVSILMICVVFITEWIQRTKEHGLEIASMPAVLRWLCYVLIIFLLHIGLLYGSKAETFIYFQF